MFFCLEPKEGRQGVLRQKPFLFPDLKGERKGDRGVWAELGVALETPEEGVKEGMLELKEEGPFAIADPAGMTTLGRAGALALVGDGAGFSKGMLLERLR